MNQAQLHKLAADVQRLNSLLLTAGKSLLKGDGGGGVKAAAAGTDFQGAISHYTVFLENEVTLQSATWTTVFELLLPAGVWVLSGQLMGNIGVVSYFVGQLWDGASNTYASGEIRNPDQTYLMYGTLPFTPIPVVLASEGSIVMSAMGGPGLTYVEPYSINANVGNNATYLTALKIG